MNNNKKGQAVVELALVLPIFLLVIVGIFDFGRALHCWSSLQHQCTQAARMAAKRNNQLVARNLFTNNTHTPLKKVEETFWANRSPMMTKNDYGETHFEGVEDSKNSDQVLVSSSYNLQLMTPFLASMVNGGSKKEGAFLISASATEKKE